MLKEEFDRLAKAGPAPRRLTGADLANRTPRTLLYGYTCDNETVHVYLDETAVLHRVVYHHSGEPVKLVDHQTEDELVLAEYAPNKRLYPEACDLEFCELLHRQGAYLPLGTFNTSRPPALWHGFRAEAFLTSKAGAHG